MSSMVMGDGPLISQGIRAAAATAAATTRMAIAAIMAGDHYNQLRDMYQERKRAQRRILAVQQRQLGRFKRFWSLDKQILKDYGTDGNPGPPLIAPETLGAVYAGRLTAITAKQYAEALSTIQCNAGKYQASFIRDSISTVMRNRAIDLSNARARGRLLGLLEYRAKSDIDFARQFDAIAIGANLLTQSAEASSKAAAIAGEIAEGNVKGFDAAVNSFKKNAQTPNEFDYMDRANQMRRDSLGLSEQSPGGKMDIDNSSYTKVSDSNNFGVMSTELHDYATKDMGAGAPGNGPVGTAEGAATSKSGLTGDMGAVDSAAYSYEGMQDRVRAGNIPIIWPVKVFDTYTGSGKGFVTIMLAPYMPTYYDPFPAIGMLL